jgi:hypothetical protein
MDLTMMERVGDRWEKMEGSCLTGQSPQWAVVPVEEEEDLLYSILTFVDRRGLTCGAATRTVTFAMCEADSNFSVFLFTNTSVEPE